MVVRRALRHGLQDVPVFDHLAVFQAEEVCRGGATVFRGGLKQAMSHNHVALGDGALDLEAHLGELLHEALYELDERLEAVSAASCAALGVHLRCSRGNNLFGQNGLQAGRLKREGRLLMRAEEEPLSGSRWRELAQLIEEKGGFGRTVWASFDWVKPLELETALEQQRQLSELVAARHLVVKTAAIEEAIDDWTPSQLRRVRSKHSAIILASEEELLLSHATPMPPS